MTDREIIEVLMKEVESTGVTCLTMVGYLADPWKMRMQKCSDACKKALTTAQEHMNKEEK